MVTRVESVVLIRRRDEKKSSPTLLSELLAIAGVLSRLTSFEFVS